MNAQAPDGDPVLTTLQSLVLPEPGISKVRLLYLRPHGAVTVAPDDGALVLDAGSRVEFNTYFNLFDAAEWQKAAGLETLEFRLSGSGKVRLRINRITPAGGKKPTGGKRELVYDETHDLWSADQVVANLTDIARDAGPCLLSPVIDAIDEELRIDEGRFVTFDRPKRTPKLTVSITTFRREAEVENTARRLDAFLSDYEAADNVRVQIVDNGSSADVPETAHIHYLTNANLGGAGGFARGMLEARRAGSTHCLFMDDDASFHMENLRRTYAMLALANDPTTAVAGAMIDNTHQHEMWENGAIFDGICRPQHIFTDLRNPQAVFRMLFNSAERLPDNAYGGWWYFAFPLDHARHYPFPFFVRGDDSGFSLANRFHIRTINGVVSFQDSFGGKATPLINYLDGRYHLIHHLVFPDLQRSAWATAMVPLRLILRSLVRFHYEAAEAQLLAIQDVLEGPQFFVEHADMSERRARIGAMTVKEKWRPLEAQPTPIRRRGYLRDRFWAATLNGHLLPFFGWFGAKRVLRLAMRGPNWPVWGARRVTYVNMPERTGYTVELDRIRGLMILYRSVVLGLRLIRAHRALLRQYRGSYDAVTSEATWEKLLGLEPAKPAPLGAKAS